MNAQAILTRIEQDARADAAQLLREAQVKAEAVRAASEKKIAEERTAALETARQNALELDDRMQRMAKLDARKALLAAKRTVLDEAFTRALQKMQAMSAAEAKAFGLAMLLDAAQGDEILIADQGSAWCDQAFVAEANQALVKAGKPGKVSLADGKQALGGGFLLRRGGMEVNCSFPAALEASRMRLEAEVAALLFG